MVDELEKLVESFPGQANLTRCFNHVLALVAKTVVRQFDVPKKKEDEALDNAEKALQELAEGADIEELAMQVEELKRQIGGEIPAQDDDDTEDWEDERAALSEIERDELDASIQPIRLVLVKVSRFK
ncbi:hypothetical protein FPV67DRAFT_1444722 [Lyophyllum atratum]|nr:hypothetical protein FPV67DRAFT_1444722 [Lyophyllum atratum]